MTIGQQLKDEADRQGLKQQWIAAQVPCSEVTVSRVFASNDRVALFYYRQIATILKIQPTLTVVCKKPTYSSDVASTKR